MRGAGRGYDWRFLLERPGRFAMSLGALIVVATPAITFVLLAAVGCDLRLSDFRRVLGQPRLVAAGVLVPPLVLPPLAIALTAWFEPPPPIASGLLLMALCPVGGISNTFTYLARGATALSVTLTALSCVLAAVTIPALGALVWQVVGQPLIARIPLSLLLGQLLSTVVLPVSLGMVVRHRWPQFAADHQASLQRTAFGLLALLVAMIVLADTRAFVANLPSAVPLSGTFVVCSVLVGGGVAHLLGGDIRDRIAVAIEFATRNVAVATTLAVLLGRLELAAFTTTYFLTELPIMTAAVIVFRAMAARGAPSTC